MLKKHGVGIGHCPQSNMKLAAGTCAGSVDAAEKACVSAWARTERHRTTISICGKRWTRRQSCTNWCRGDPKTLSAEQAFAMATIGGARALHMEDLIGSIEIGKRADIAIVDFDSLNQTPLYNIYSHLVYATKANDVRTVIIQGRVVMLDRRLLTLKRKCYKKRRKRLPHKNHPKPV